MRYYLLLTLAVLLALWLALVWVKQAEGAPYEASRTVQESVEATVTAYCDNGETASGYWTEPGTVAHASLDFGTSVDIPGYGWGVVKDRGLGDQWYGENWFDVWIQDCKEALQWGVRELRVEVVR